LDASCKVKDATVIAVFDKYDNGPKLINVINKPALNFIFLFNPKWQSIYKKPQVCRKGSTRRENGKQDFAISSKAHQP
jgi:hypothetical protein